MEKIDQTKITASTMKASSKISSTKVDSASTRPRKQKIYDPIKGRMVSVDPFGKRAKQLGVRSANSTRMRIPSLAQRSHYDMRWILSERRWLRPSVFVSRLSMKLYAAWLQ